VPQVLTPFDDEATVAAAFASTRHWLEAAVIGLNLCPFAKAVHTRRQIRWAVTAATTEAELLAELRHELELLARTDPNEIETTLLIHPRAMTQFIDYRFFLRKTDTALRKLGYEGRLQVASFHPDYEFAVQLARTFNARPVRTRLRWSARDTAKFFESRTYLSIIRFYVVRIEHG
jgi:hypothetical protein